MLQSYLSLDGLRSFLVLTTATAQMGLAYLPDMRKSKHTITSRAEDLESAIVPIGWAFAIWGPIFITCLVFAIWQFLPANLEHPFARQIGWMAIAVFLACSIWEVIVPKKGYVWVSLLLSVLELIWLSAISISLAWGRWALSPVEYWIVAIPFMLFAGWVTVAVFVNLALILKAKGFQVGRSVSFVLLILVGLAAAVGTALSDSWIYSIAVAWGLIGIVAANILRDKNVLIAGAASALVFVVGCLGIVTGGEAVAPLQASTASSVNALPSVKQVETSELLISYCEYGPINGQVVIALHGFPDDAGAWDDVGKGLAAKGYRVLAPNFRGFGDTVFKQKDTPRSGQLAALVTDTIAFADALEIETFSMIGHDWGSRAAQGVAALYPERVTQLVTFSGYSLSYAVGDPPPVSFIPRLWYQFALNMPMGEGIVQTNPADFSYTLWREWSPAWNITDLDIAFSKALVGLENPDFPAVALSGYSYTGVGHDPALLTVENQLAAAPKIAVPAVVIEGEQDGLEIAGRTKELDQVMFTGGVEHISIPNVGHWPHREAPSVIIQLFQ